MFGKKERGPGGRRTPSTEVSQRESIPSTKGHGMNTACRRFARWLLTLGLIALLVPACAKRKTEEAPPEDVGVVTPEEPSRIDEYADQENLKREFDEVMYEKLYTQARSLRNTGQYNRALEQVQEALHFNPTSDEALQLRNELLTLTGERSGEVTTVLDDQWEAYKAKRDEQKVAVERWLAKADRAVTAQDWDEAKRAYETALFIVTTAKYAPLGEDDELGGLGQRAETGLAELDRRAAEAHREQERRDTEDALLRIAEQEEKSLLESRDRRARLLSAAIDRSLVVAC